MAASLAACYKPPPAGTEEPLQVMEDFTMTQTSAGSKSWVLQAPLAKAALSGDAHLSLPVVHFFRDGKQSSEARSREAVVHGEPKDVTMIGDVVVVTGEEKSRLKTARLEYHTKSKRFTTEEAVTLERSGSVTRGRGMDADSELNEINIYHQETALQ